MQPISAVSNTHQAEKIANLERKAGGLTREERNTLSMGSFYNKLNGLQRLRFKRIVGSICRKLGVNALRSPLQMILIKRIAINTILIEDYEAMILGEGYSQVSGENGEKWRFQAGKDLREAIETLMLISKTTEKKQSLGSFGAMRDELRDQEGLNKSDATINPDGHDRRHYDGISRTITSE